MEKERVEHAFIIRNITQAVKSGIELPTLTFVRPKVTYTIAEDGLVISLPSHMVLLT